MNLLKKKNTETRNTITENNQILQLMVPEPRDKAICRARKRRQVSLIHKGTIMKVSLYTKSPHQSSKDDQVAECQVQDYGLKIRGIVLFLLLNYY